MDQLRTLIIHPALAPYRIDLFNRLADHFPLEVVVQRPYLAYHRDLTQDRLRAQLRCARSDLPGNRIILGRDVPLGVGKLIRRWRPDVVVTSEFSMVSLMTGAARRRQGSRFGHVIWSDENLATLSSHGAVRHALRRWCSRRADALVMCSRAVADAFAHRYGLERTRIFLCGVHQDPGVLRSRLRAARDSAMQRVRERDWSGRKIVLFVGRLAPEKNLPLAFHAFHRACGEDHSVLFVLIGSGSERPALEKLRDELGLANRVRFIGHVEGDALIEWYRLASVLLLPSIYEPYGAVVNEALICGVPVLCSNRAGAAVLLREGTNGFTFSPPCQDELVDRLRRMAPYFLPVDAAAARERDDLMPVSFEDDVNGFRDAIHAAAGRKIGR